MQRRSTGASEPVRLVRPKPHQFLAKTQPSRVSACSEARTLCNGKEKMTYVVEYVCSSGWPHQSLSASDAPALDRL